MFSLSRKHFVPFAPTRIFPRFKSITTHGNLDLTVAFQQVFWKLLTAGRVKSQAGLVVAVSGGPDSMALAHLLNQWSKSSKVPIYPVVVDHRVRPESGKEGKAQLPCLAC